MSKHEPPVSPGKIGEDHATKPVNQSRRRLSKAALAAPIVASLSARPAMACSVSGFISGNTSPGRTPPTCQGYGCTPGFWKNNPEVWLRTGGYSAGSCGKRKANGDCEEWIIGGTKLADILTCANPFNVSASEYLLAILKEGVGGSGYADVCHYIAAILNAAATPAYGSTVAEIQQGLCIASTSTPNQVNYYTTVLLAKLNERGCMYDAHGNCEKDFVLNTGSPKQCIPACPTGTHFDPVSVRCVPN